MTLLNDGKEDGKVISQTLIWENVYSQATFGTRGFFKSASLFIVHGSRKFLHRC